MLLLRSQLEAGQSRAGLCDELRLRPMTSLPDWSACGLHVSKGSYYTRCTWDRDMAHQRGHKTMTGKAAVLNARITSNKGAKRMPSVQTQHSNISCDPP